MVHGMDRRAPRLVALSLLISGAHAGPGLLPRHADRYYKPPVRRTLHPPDSLPPLPPAELGRGFSDEDLLALEGAGYLEDYQGPSWNREGPCTRFQAAFLLGGLIAEANRVYGEIFPLHLIGRRRRLVPRRPGFDRVALAVTERVLQPKPSQLHWWDVPPDRYQVAKWVAALLEAMTPRVPVLVDPRPYQDSAGGDLPYYGHPMRRRMRRAIETRVMQAPSGVFRGRQPLGARECVRIVNRLRYILHGYKARRDEI